MPTGEHVTEEVTDLIDKLMVSEPENRLGAEKIDELLAHPFFEGIKFD